MLGRLAHELAAIGVGDDQAGVLRENLRRHMGGGGEIEPVAVKAIGKRT